MKNSPDTDESCFERCGKLLSHPAHLAVCMRALDLTPNLYSRPENFVCYRFQDGGKTRGEKTRGGKTGKKRSGDLPPPPSVHGDHFGGVAGAAARSAPVDSAGKVMEWIPCLLFYVLLPSSLCRTAGHIDSPYVSQLP